MNVFILKSELMATLATSKKTIIIELRTSKNERATMGVGREGWRSPEFSSKTFFEIFSVVLANI